jgi:antitoxin component YwqK of YwqJK toxin-antitoxin module
MIRLFLFLFLALLSFENFGQDTVNQTDAFGKKQGYWRKADSSGGKVYEGHFRNGIPYGEFRYYYPDGKQKAVSVVSDSGRFSRTTSYFKNGWKMAEGNYRNEKKDSLWKFYSEIDGTMVSEEFYKDGKKDGIAKTYYPGDGQVAETVTWKNGIKEGSWREFYSDGKIKINGTYKAGEKDGNFKAFYESGDIMVIGWYVNGHTQGTWNYFTPKGTLQKMETYKDGVLMKTQEMDTGKK